MADIMRCETATNAPEYRNRQHKTPHNHALRIIDSADEDAVAGSVFAAGARIGNDTDVLGLKGQRDDLAAEVIAGLLEGSDGSHCRSPC